MKRSLFLESAIAKTDSFKDGWVRRHDNPYVKGGERERFNPLSGATYERLEPHDANDQDDAASTSTNKFSTREGYQPKRGRPNFFKKEERLKWKGKGRLNSPYRKNVTESTVKTVEVNKTKEKS